MTLATVTPAFIDDYGIINAAALNSWRTDLPLALDGAEGGSYAPAAPINVRGSGFGTIKLVTLAETAVGGQNVDPLGAIITDVDAQVFTLAQGQSREFATPTAQRDHEISVTDATPGSWIHFSRPAAGNFSIILHRVGSGGAIVTLPGLTWSTATVYFDVAGVWRLRSHSSATPGADA